MHVGRADARVRAVTCFLGDSSGNSGRAIANAGTVARDPRRASRSSRATVDGA